MAKNDLKLVKTKKPQPPIKGQQFIQVYTPMQFYLLQQLERMISIKNSYRDHPSKEKWLERSVGRAIYAYLRDCMEQGVGEQAKAALHRQQSSN